MSRSTKKIGIIKDKGMPRGIYNRRFRRVNKQRVNEGKEPFLLKELINGYDVCDFKLTWESPYTSTEFQDKDDLRGAVKRRLEYFVK